MTKNDKHQFKLLLVLMKHFLTTLDPLIFFILPVQRMIKINVHAFSAAEGQCFLYAQAIKLLTLHKIVINRYACKFLLFSPNCHSLIFL